MTEKQVIYLLQMDTSCHGEYSKQSHKFISNTMNPSSLDEELTEQGLFIDDVYQLRILDPSVADQTTHLKKECDHFLTSNTILITIVKTNTSL